MARSDMIMVPPLFFLNLYKYKLQHRGKFVNAKTASATASATRAVSPWLPPWPLKRGFKGVTPSRGFRRSQG